MIQWVASPLNQGYSPLTRMTQEGQMEEARSPLIAKETNLDTSAIHSLIVTKTLTHGRLR